MRRNDLRRKPKRAPAVIPRVPVPMPPAAFPAGQIMVRPTCGIAVGTDRSILKTVYWDKNRFCLRQKRLERDRFPWSESEGAALRISGEERAMVRIAPVHPSATPGSIVTPGVSCLYDGEQVCGSSAVLPPVSTLFCDLTKSSV